MQIKKKNHHTERKTTLEGTTWLELKGPTEQLTTYTVLKDLRFIIKSVKIWTVSVLYLLVLPEPLLDPLLGLCKVRLHLDQAQLAAALDQLVGLGNQFLKERNKCPVLLGCSTVQFQLLSI